VTDLASFIGGEILKKLYGNFKRETRPEMRSFSIIPALNNSKESSNSFLAHNVIEELKNPIAF